MQNAGVCEVLFDMSMASKLVNCMAQKKYPSLGISRAILWDANLSLVGIIAGKLMHMCSAVCLYVCMYMYMCAQSVYVVLGIVYAKCRCL